MRPALVSFDFNGTIHDDLSVAYGAMAKIFEILNLEVPTLEAYRAGCQEDFMNFYHGHGVPTYITADQLSVIHRLYHDARRDVMELRPDFEETARGLITNGTRLGICSAGSPNLIVTQINKAGLDWLFEPEMVVGGTGDKAAALLRQCEQVGVDPAAAWYVNDTRGGLESARHAGLKAIGFANATAYAPRAVIAAARPHAIITELSELMTLDV